MNILKLILRLLFKQIETVSDTKQNGFIFKATILDKDGLPDKNGNEALGTLSYGDKSWPAISGRWGKGYLPQGLYEAYGFWDESGEAYSYKDEHDRKIGFYIRLEPKFKTDRTQLLIHFDGNVEGTLGCIGIKPTGYLNALDAYSDLKKIMQVGKVPLEVKYS